MSKLILSLLLTIASFAYSQPLFVSSAKATTIATQPTTTTITVPTPTGLQKGDLLLAFLGTSGTRTLTIPAPNGWIPLGDFTSTAYYTKSYGFYRLVDGTELPQYTFSGSSSSLGVVATIVSYRGTAGLGLVKWWEFGQTYPSGVAPQTTTPNSLAVFFLTADWPNEIEGVSPATMRVALESNDNSGAEADLLMAMPGTIPNPFLTSEYYLANQGAPSVTIVLLPATPCTCK